MNKIIEEFVKNYPNEHTKRNYSNLLNHYFKTMEIKNPDEYLEIGRDYNQDILDYQAKLNGRPPKSIKLCISCVMSFLLSNNIELQPKTKFALRNRRKGSRAWTQDGIFTPDILREILQYASVKSRALFLLLSSSGARVGETLQLTIDDIDMKHNPMKIYMRGEYTKSGDSRTIFASNETRNALTAWLKVRDSFLESACRKINKGKYKHNKNTDDPRIFPVDYPTVKLIWNTMIEKAGYDERDPKTKRRRFHIHGLRKYFGSRIGIDSDITEALLGHEEGVKTIYKRYTDDNLGEMYLEGMFNLQVFERENADLTEVHDQVSTLQEENERLKKQLDEINRKLDSGVATYLFDELQKIKKRKK